MALRMNFKCLFLANVSSTYRWVAIIAFKRNGEDSGNCNYVHYVQQKKKVNNLLMGLDKFPVTRYYYYTSESVTWIQIGWSR